MFATGCSLLLAVLLNQMEEACKHMLCVARENVEYLSSRLPHRNAQSLLRRRFACWGHDWLHAGLQACWRLLGAHHICGCTAVAYRRLAKPVSHRHRVVCMRTAIRPLLRSWNRQSTAEAAR